jgi:hypothetical protein
MKNKALMIVAACAAFLVASCATSTTGGPSLAIPVAIGYRVPDTDVVVVLRPDTTKPSGYNLTISGTYKGLEQTPTGWKFTSAKNGLVYLIDTSGPTPGLTVIGSGDLGGGFVVNPPPEATK